VTNVDEILAQLNPKLRKKISLGSDIEQTTFAKTPSFGLNRSLNGGLPYGRQVLIYGNKSSGKSSFCLQTIAQAQKQGKVCAWIDAEMTYSPEWAEALGVDNSTLIHSTARTMNDMVDVGTELMKAGADIIVVDSISALLPAIYFEKDSADLKQLENTKQIGAESRDMANAVKMLNYANNQVKPTLLILFHRSGITLDLCMSLMSQLVVMLQSFIHQQSSSCFLVSQTTKQLKVRPMLVTRLLKKRLAERFDGTFNSRRQVLLSKVESMTFTLEG